ncbi:hypothetical protein M413DRAFT_66000 [Hebeloma cylindrosporum]|uniref:ML-like domain-containing protein n=1 Tax=Hebeloma cylindrosporum TaxID=76867 RepID=A0A0C2Y6A6_HEBCY|nr:hypothetical protein M413DRAFT_66000 [Hebeloma cylindrosporum h7]
MFSLLAWPRALAFSALLFTWTPYAYAREESIHTSSVTYCNPPETLLIQRLELAFFPANNSISFNVSAASVQANVNVSANLFLNVYGMNPVNVTLDLCGILKGALCPLPMYNFTGADSLTLPSSLGIIEKIPGIAFKIPDLEGFAQLTLTEVNTGKVKACVQATISNGWSAHQPAVAWTLGGVTLGALLVALGYSILSPESMIPFRFVELMYLYQAIASSAFLNLNYPSVYRAYALNYSWAMGLISASLQSSLQNSINHMRHLTGGKLADAIGGSAVSLVNRKLSPYNSPTSNLVLGFDSLKTYLAESNFAAELSARLPKLSESFSYAGLERRDTIVNGLVQTVTSTSSNVLQVGLPIYVNTLHIATANAFMTVFICALCIFAIAIAVFVLGYGILALVQRIRAKRHPTAEPIDFDYPSFVISWFLRVSLVMFFPFFIFIFYQWTLEDSWLSIFLAVISFIAICGFVLYPTFVTLRLANQESSFVLYAKSKQLDRNGPLYAQYRPERYYFFVPLLVAFLLRAIAISFVKPSSEAQITILMVVEFGLVASHFALKPAKTKGGDVFTTYIAIMRLVSTALMIAFIQRLHVKAIPRVVIGIVIALAWSVAVVITIGNFAWTAVAEIRAYISSYAITPRRVSANIARGTSMGAILEKGAVADESGSHHSGDGSGESLPFGGSLGRGLTTHEIEEVSRGRPRNPTPENNVPFNPYNHTAYPISPASTVTTMEPPSMSSRDSGTLTVGSLLPRRWSFSFSQPGSPAGSSFGHQRNSLTPSPSEAGSHSNHSTSAGVSRNTSLRVHQPRHEDIQEEELLSTTTTRPTS